MILILGVDGLEYDLVKKWNLKNLMQKTYGSIKIGEEYGVATAPVWRREKPVKKIPYTPIVWTSFLTGRKPEEHGVREMQAYNPILDRVRKLPVISWVKNKRKLFWKIGVKPKIVSKEYYKYTTFFDECKSSKAIYFIMYNQPTWIWRRMQETAKYLGGKYTVDDLVDRIWEVYMLRREKLMSSLNQSWRLIGVYFETVDWLGHLWFVTNKLGLYKAYKKFDNLVKQLKTMVGEDTIILIVSDHGMQDSGDGVTGNHSDHNFWSLNIETSWRPNDITDFYPKILEWCNMEGDEEE